VEKKIVVFASTSAQRRHALHAIGFSAKRLGLNCEISNAHGYKECDVAVVWGLPKTKTGKSRLSQRKSLSRQDIFERHQGRFVILEAPVLGRRVRPRESRHWVMKALFPESAPWTRFLLPEASYKPDPFDHYRVGLGGFPDQGGLALAPFCGNRWESLSRRLGIPEVLPYRKEGRHIVVVGQVPGDASLRGEDINQWLMNTCAELRKLTERPIVARLHPLAQVDGRSGVYERLAQLSVKVDHPSHPFVDTMKGAWSVVTYSSGAAVDALLAGVPAVAVSPASYAWDVTDHELNRAVNPTLFERGPWLQKLAAAHWHHDEIMSGDIWKPIMSALAFADGASKVDDYS
jgi:hypothetical protein